MEKEKLEHSQLKFSFEVTAEAFEKALDYSFEKNNKNVTLKGFRKGHAPRNVFEKEYGVEALYEEALNYIFREQINEIVKDKELTKQFVGEFMPVLDEKIERGKAFKAALVIDVYPEVTLPKYKGVEVTKADTEVNAEELNNAIEMLRKPHSKKENKDSDTLENDDIAVFDFKGFVDGEAFEGGEANNYELKIGSHQFIPGFEDQMIGMKKGEEKDLNVTFPKEYGASHLAGKDAVFKVKLHEIKVEVLPELNDEFVKSLNLKDVNTVEELKTSKTNELKERKTQAERDRQVDTIINNILDNTVCDMPQSMIDERVNGLRAQYENQAKMYNIPFETFLQLVGLDKEKFEANTLEQGKRQALFNVVMSKLIEVEKLEPAEDVLKTKVESIAKDKAKPTAQEYMRAYSDLAYQNLVEFLLANASYVDKKAE